MSHLCPSCGKEFKSEHGVRIHHVQIHGRSLLESHCQVCNKPMRKYRETHNFCSNNCRNKHFSLYFSKNAKTKCENCSAEFDVHPSRINRCCSRKCYLEWKRRNQRKLNCEICGQEVSCAPYDKSRRFCSKSCEAKWKSLAYKGKCTGRARKTIVYTCQQCGKLFPDNYYTGERKFCSKKCAVEAFKDRTPKQCKKCGRIFEVSHWNADRSYCSWQCFRSDKGETEPERRFREFLEANNVSFVQEWRIPHSAFHADFYLHEHDVIFEIDGSYWHSQPAQMRRDSRKDVLCEAMGIEIIRLLEDKDSGWKAPDEMVQKQIAMIIGKEEQS